MLEAQEKGQRVGDFCEELENQLLEAQERGQRVGIFFLLDGF